MNAAMFQPGYFPMPQQNQRAFFPPTMAQMRPWQQPSINRPYNVQMQQQRGRGNVPRGNMSGGNMGGRSNNPSGNQRPVGAAQQRNMSQSQATVQQQQQQQAKLKFNANARNQPDALPTGGQAVGGDRQGIQQVYY